MENPKTRNKKELNPKSNLNLSNKKTNISYPNLKKKWRKMYRIWFRQSDGGRYIA